MLPMAARRIDDKTSDTLVVGLRLMVLDEEFDSPPSPPDLVPLFTPNAAARYCLRRANAAGHLVGET